MNGVMECSCSLGGYGFYIDVRQEGTSRRVFLCWPTRGQAESAWIRQR